MKVVIGSHNKAKLGAVKSVFTEAHIIPCQVASDVAAQPLTSEETRQGALNRAYNCQKQYEDDICIGLEGGVMLLDNVLYLCSWGALVRGNKHYTAGGPNLVLPSEFIQPLQNGKELASLMEAYTKKRDIRHNEGAVGIFSNGQMTRSELFAHIVLLLKGQMEYDNK